MAVVAGEREVFSCQQYSRLFGWKTELRTLIETTLGLLKVSLRAEVIFDDNNFIPW